MGQPKVTLYVDVVSPFAYTAFHILQVNLIGCPTGDNETGQSGHLI
jgi:hypothetical protein